MTKEEAAAVTQVRDDQDIVREIQKDFRGLKEVEAEGRNILLVLELVRSSTISS